MLDEFYFNGGVAEFLEPIGLYFYITRVAMTEILALPEFIVNDKIRIQDRADRARAGIEIRMAAEDRAHAV